MPIDVRRRPPGDPVVTRRANVEELNLDRHAVDRPVLNRSGAPVRSVAKPVIETLVAELEVVASGRLRPVVGNLRLHLRLAARGRSEIPRRSSPVAGVEGE